MNQWISELGDDNCLHVMPVGDLKPHVKGSECECDPDYEMIDDSFHDLKVHHAFDGRTLAGSIDITALGAPL